MIGMCNWTAWWFRPDGRLSRAQVAELISDMAVQCLVRSPEGGTQSSLGEVLASLEKEIGYLQKRVSRC